MKINGIYANNAEAMRNTGSTRFNQWATPQTNSVFKRDSFSTGHVASQFQTYSANQSRTNENWCISAYYKVRVEEVSPILTQLRQELDEKVFIGMTDFEIYDYIENRFVETFGEDFRMAMHLGVIDPVSSCPVFTNMNTNLVRSGAFDENGVLQHSRNFKSIGNEFYIVLQGHFGDFVGGPNFTRDVNRTRLFGDMGNEEIMDAIRAEFPKNLTNRDVALMTSKMVSVGVLSSPIMGIPSDLSYEFNDDGTLRRIKSDMEQNEIWLNMLDKAFDPSHMFRHFNKVARANELTQWDFEFRDFAVRFFGAVLDSDGLFKIW